MSTWWRFQSAVLVMLALASPALAAFPDKPINIAVGFGAGGTTDVMARAVADILSKQLGQPVPVENKPGAGGAVAVTALTKLAPDGYNLVATTSTTITFDPHATKLAFGVDDLTYIAAIGEFPEAYISHPDRGWKSLVEALAEGKGKGFNYASTTSIDRVVTQIIAKKAGTPLAAVPTRGGAEAVTQVMGKHVDLAYSSGAYVPQAKAGNVKVLAVLGEKRSDAFRDAPTLIELGYDVVSINLILFVAPKGTAPEARDKLRAAFAAAAKDKVITDLMMKRDIGPVVLIGDELEKTMKAHSARFKSMIERSKAP